MTSDPVVSKGDGAPVRLRVSPNARRTQLRGLHAREDPSLIVAAHPVDGEANAAVERFLAEKTGVPPPDARVVRGTSGRDKTVLARGVGAERVREVLAPHPG